MALGLFFSSLLILLGLATGSRQFATRRRLREEPYAPEIDRLYFRGQVRRRLVASAFMIAIGAMIGYYYLAGMDARLNAINARDQDTPPTDEEKSFGRCVVIYWIVVLVLLAMVGCVAVADFWATRVYWMVRYREMKTDHETKLQRDLAVYRQQKLNARMKGLKKPDDDTTPEGHPPAE